MIISSNSSAWIWRIEPIKKRTTVKKKNMLTVFQWLLQALPSCQPRPSALFKISETKYQLRQTRVSREAKQIPVQKIRRIRKLNRNPWPVLWRQSGLEKWLLVSGYNMPPTSINPLLKKTKDSSIRIFIATKTAPPNSISPSANQK